jgi:sugar phosphate isomerase/epimerase
MQTTPYKEWTLEKTFEHLSKLGFEAVEIAAWPWYTPFKPDEIVGGGARQITTAAKRCNLVITALTCHVNHIHPDSKARAEANNFFRKVILCAKLLEAPIVTAWSGKPIPAKMDEENFQEIRHEMGRLVDYAAQEDVKIAVENYGPTLTFNVPRMEKLFKMIPSKNLCANFDPSHCIWQRTDYVTDVKRLGSKIVHTHAKDTEILKDVLAVEGVQGQGWWRFRIPGKGAVNWKRLIAAYGEIGYDSVLSFEHEDQTVDRDTGAKRTLRYLRRLI